MILGWIMIRPSQTSVKVLFCVGRASSGWLNERHGLSLSATDTALPGGATNGGSGYTLTFTPSGYTEQTSAISDLDNDSLYGFRSFEITGLSAGDTVDFSASVDTGQNYNPAVTGTLKTLPSGAIKKGYLSCQSDMDNTNIFPDSDYGTWMKVARVLVNTLDVDYVSWIDDFTYYGVGQSWSLGGDRYFPPHNVSSDTPYAPQPAGGINNLGQNLIDADMDRASGDFRLGHMFACLISNPAVQMLGQHCPMCFVAGDHDFLPGNDWDHDALNSANQNLDDIDTVQKAVDCWREASRFWHSIFGTNASPATNSSAPTTAVYPDGIMQDASGNPIADPVATYGAAASDYYPIHFVIETDYLSDYHPDFLTHRSSVGDDSVSSTLLGATQLSDLKTALTNNNRGGSNEKPYIVLSNAKQMYTGVVNNGDSYVRSPTYAEGVPTPTVGLPTATDERDEIVTHLKGLDKASPIFCGDSHCLQASIDENIFEFNVSALCQRNARSNAVQQETSTSNQSMDDLFNDAEIATEHSGQYMAGWANGVNFDTEPTGNIDGGFGFSEFTATKARHVMLDVNGYPVSAYETYPYTKGVYPLTQTFSSGANMANESVELFMRPHLAVDGTKVGLGQPDDFALGAAFSQYNIGDLDANGRRYATINNLGTMLFGKQKGLAIVFDGPTTNNSVGDAMGSESDAEIEWPSAYQITFSDEDGSNAVTLDGSDSPAISTINTDDRRFLFDQDTIGATFPMALIFTANSGSTTSVTFDNSDISGITQTIADDYVGGTVFIAATDSPAWGMITAITVGGSTTTITCTTLTNGGTFGTQACGMTKKIHRLDGLINLSAGSATEFSFINITGVTQAMLDTFNGGVLFNCNTGFEYVVTSIALGATTVVTVEDNNAPNHSTSDEAYLYNADGYRIAMSFEQQNASSGGGGSARIIDHNIIG